MKLKVPQPLQRRHRGPSGDVDLRDDPSPDDPMDDQMDDPMDVSVYDPTYDTAEHDVYVPEERASRPSSGRARGGRPRFDLRNTWQVLAGSILIPVGVAGIILAWYGAAHARVDQQQIPYLISGGFLGLGAIIAGALMYWAHWLYRIYDQADLQHQQFLRSQAELRDALLGMASGGDRNLNGSAPRARGEGTNAGAQFVATASGNNFHRPDCPIVARRPNGLHEVSDREAEELQACRICEPLAAES